MPMTSVAGCSQCEAVVNIFWPSCFVCRALLPPVPEAATPPQLTPNNPEGAGAPIAPILPGWLVTYRDQAGRLRGGYEEKAHGTVQACLSDAGRWTVCLTDGQRVPLFSIRAVGKTAPQGNILSAWDVKRHGYDGRKQESPHE